MMPWRSEEAQPGSYSPGPLGLDERKLLYHLGRDFADGSGAIVDLGAFCGASALCLAAGVRDNPQAKPRIHSYDQFVAGDPYTVQYLNDQFGQNLTLGGSFEAIYREAIKDFADFIDVHPGDITKEVWNAEDKIDVLFIDLAKSPEIQGHVLEQFLPALVPGRSIVVQQDFYHPSTPWIPVVMGYLEEYFSVVDPRRDWSAVYRLEKPIPGNVLTRAIAYDFTKAEEREYLVKAFERNGEDKHFIHCSAAALLEKHHDSEVARQYLDGLQFSQAVKDSTLWVEFVRWSRESYGAEVA